MRDRDAQRTIADCQNDTNTKIFSAKRTTLTHSRTYICNLHMDIVQKYRNYSHVRTRLCCGSRAIVGILRDAAVSVFDSYVV